MRKSKNWPRMAACLLVLVSLGSCGSKASSSGQEALSPNPKLKTAVLRSGSVSLVAELATTSDECQRGLMFRKSLAEGSGMLFIFDADEHLTFWMKNTSLPLSVAYISADGTIREIHDLVPYSLAPVEAARAVRYALEVPRGWFEKVGLKVGDRFELPSRG